MNRRFVEVIFDHSEPRNDLLSVQYNILLRDRGCIVQAFLHAFQIGGFGDIPFLVEPAGGGFQEVFVFLDFFDRVMAHSLSP